MSEDRPEIPSLVGRGNPCLKARSEIVLDSDGYRSRLRIPALEGLIESIKRDMIREALWIRPLRDTGKWKVFAGNRRLHAYDLSGRTDPIPCVDFGDISVVEEKKFGLISNVQRSDPDFVDTARGLLGFKDAGGLNNKQVAEALGIDPSTVSRHLTILEQGDDFLAMIAQDGLGFAEAYAKCSKPRRKDPKKRKRFTFRAPNGLVLTVMVEAAQAFGKTLGEAIRPILVKAEKNPDLGIEKLK